MNNDSQQNFSQKTEGYGSLDNRSHGKTERSRHYQAAEQDTSNITLPEGFEVIKSRD